MRSHRLSTSSNLRATASTFELASRSQVDANDWTFRPEGRIGNKVGSSLVTTERTVRLEARFAGQCLTGLLGLLLIPVSCHGTHRLPVDYTAAYSLFAAAYFASAIASYIARPYREECARFVTIPAPVST